MSEPVAIICFAQCYACICDCHYDPPQAHTWMDKEDAEHAGHPWPLPPEIAAAKPCACPCAREDAGKASESTPAAPSPVSAATEASGGAGEAQEGTQ